MTGKGKFWASNGDFYEGKWMKGKAHEFGIFKSANGSKYIG